jgi:hypothetical protein
MPTTPGIAACRDAAADSFDDEADHGLRRAHVGNAWAARRAARLPSPPGNVVDLGGPVAATLTGPDRWGRRADDARRAVIATR